MCTRSQTHSNDLTTKRNDNSGPLAKVLVNATVPAVERRLAASIGYANPPRRCMSVGAIHL